MKKQGVGSFLGLIMALFILPACHDGQQPVATPPLGEGGMPPGTTGAATTSVQPGLEGEASVSVIKEVVEFVDGEVGRKQVYEYNETGELIKKITQIPNAEGLFENESTIDFSYAENKITRTNAAALPTGYSKVEFELDDQKRIKTILTYLASAPERVNKRVELDYPEEGDRPIAVREFNAGRDEMLPANPTLVRSFEYEEGGYLWRSSWSSASGADSIERNIYDDNGYVGRRDSQYRPRSDRPYTVGSKNFENYYDSQGRLVTRRDVLSGGGFHDLFILFYDAQGNLTSKCWDEDADGGVFSECHHFSYISLPKKPIIPVENPTRKVIEDLTVFSLTEANF